MMTETTQPLNNNDSKASFTLIVKYAIKLGFCTPFVSWAWSQLAEAKLLKLSLFAFKQVFLGARPISSLALPFGLIILLISVPIVYMVLLNRITKELIAQYKEEARNFQHSPIQTVNTLTKTTFAVAMFGGSAFLASKFIILR